MQAAAESDATHQIIRGLSFAGELVTIAVLEILLTLALRDMPDIDRYAASLSYLYLIVVALSGAAWGFRPALFAILFALVMLNVWVLPSGGPLSENLAHNVRLALFGGVATALALVQASAGQKLKQKSLEAQAHAAVTTALQEAMGPEMTAIPGYDVAHLYQPASHYTSVGGDFVDVFSLGDKRVGLAIGDVTGHGKEAAVQTLQLCTMLEMCARQGQSPSECLASLNEAVFHSGRMTLLATLFYGELDLETHSLKYSSAGHGPTLLWSPSQRRTEQLNITGLLLGAVPSIEAGYANATISINPGDALLLYTDGLNEARHDAEFYSEERIQSLFQSLSDAGANSVVTGLYEGVSRFTSGDLQDDVALLCVRRPPGQGHSNTDEEPVAIDMPSSVWAENETGSTGPSPSDGVTIILASM